jgi:hypothetical protein
LILAYHGALFVRHPPRLLPGGVIFGNAPEASQSDIGIVSNSSKAAVSPPLRQISCLQRAAHAKDCPALPVSILDNGKKRKLNIKATVPVQFEGSTKVEADCLHALQAALRASRLMVPLLHVSQMRNTLHLCVQQQGRTARLCTFLPSSQGSWVDRIRCSCLNLIGPLPLSYHHQPSA